MIPCPECGRPAAAEAEACANCGHALGNGVQAQSPAKKPAPPAEASGWAVCQTPPDLLAWARQTFDEDEFLEGAQEVAQTGGVRFEDFIGEIEAVVKGRD